jgi:hypothetical protein
VFGAETLRGIHSRVPELREHHPESIDPAAAKLAGIYSSDALMRHLEQRTFGRSGMRIVQGSRRLSGSNSTQRDSHDGTANVFDALDGETREDLPLGYRPPPVHLSVQVAAARFAKRRRHPE